MQLPVIMHNAQRIFHNTLSIRYYPELHKTNIEALKEFITEGSQLNFTWVWKDELEDNKREYS